jgi:NAD(P)-dependent dehydrogenase (short-subunit alcohol dehydrogenase family)
MEARDMGGRLSGAVAAVTGAGTGLGLGIATELAKAGADSAVVEIDGESAERAATRSTRRLPRSCAISAS